MNSLDTRAVVCPLCPLHCDQVHFTAEGTSPVCELADRRWSELRSTNDRIAGDVDADEIASVLRANRPVVVHAGGMDLTIAKTLMRLVREGHIRLVTSRSVTQAAISDATGREGVIRATLGDVHRHADLLWLLGSIELESPRLLDEIVRADQPPEIVIQREGVTAEELANLAVHLRDGNGGQDGVADAVLKSRYLAVLLGSDAFGKDEADLSAVMLGRILRRRNQTSRAVLATLDPAISLDSVSWWTLGQAVETWDGQAVDLSIVGGLAESSPNVPCRWQIGGVDPGWRIAEHFVAAAPVGLSRGGVVIRGDSTVTLPLGSPIPCERPSASEWLERIFATDQGNP